MLGAIGNAVPRAAVSIRARHCWRAMRQQPHHRVGARHVSIRARHCWRAMPYTAAWSASNPLFQSAPAIAGGRCGARRAPVSLQRRFNPRPPLLAGDAPWPARTHPGCPSFNPRPPLLAGDACPELGRHDQIRGFNPRPPLLAGDAMLSLQPTATALFQSAPAIAGGRCAAHGGQHGEPHVSIRARHCWRAMPRCRAGQRGPGRCFNPRPPLLAGDATP